MKRIMAIVVIAMFFGVSVFGANIIQIRRDTNANWNTANPTLAQGELGYVLDTGKLKIGTGTDNWAALSFYTTSGVTRYSNLDDANAVGSIAASAIAGGGGGATSYGALTDANQAGSINISAIVGAIASGASIWTWALPADFNSLYKNSAGTGLVAGDSIWNLLLPADFNSLYKNAAESDPVWTGVSANYAKTTDINGIFARVLDINGTYAKTTDINSAFLRNADSNQIYVRQIDGNIWYVKVTDVNGTYAKITDINSTFLRNSDVNQVYVRQTDGNAWYGKIGSSNIWSWILSADFNTLYKNAAGGGVNVGDPVWSLAMPADFNTLYKNSSASNFQQAKYVVDDTAGGGNYTTIAAALAALNAEAYTEGTIYVRAGYYPISSTIDLNTGQWLVGDGAGTSGTMLACDLTDAPCIRFKGIADGTNHSQFVGIKDMFLDGGGRANAQTGILVQGTQNFIISGLRIVNFKGAAMDFNDAWDGVIKDNWINSCGDAGTSTASIKLEDGVNHFSITTNELRFINNLFESSYYNTLDIGKYAWSNHFTDNKFHGQVPALDYNMVTVAKSAQAQSFIGNKFHQGGTPSYVALDGNYNVIIGNAFNYGKGDSVTIDGNNNIVIGNTTQNDVAYATPTHYKDLGLGNTLSANNDNGTTIPAVSSGTTDTNWATGWAVFDTNMNYYFPRKTDINGTYGKIGTDSIWSWILPADFNSIYINAGGSDTNWQTSYPTFDANMALRYVKQTDGNAWYGIKKTSTLWDWVTPADFNTLYINTGLAKTSDINSTFLRAGDVNGLYSRITDTNGADILRAKILDVNGADALRALITDVNGADALRTKITDINGTYLNALTGGTVAKDLNVTSGINKGVGIKSDLNKVCFPATTCEMSVDFNGTAMIIG